MAVFCYGALPGNGTCSTTDQLLNYTFGVLFIFIFLLSFTLNPLVFLYNYKQKQSMATMLFQVTSILDFLTNIYQPIATSVRLFKRAVDVRGRATVLDIMSSVYIAPLAQSSGMVTTLLAVTRFIQIRSPFYRIHKGAVLGYAMCYVVALYTCYIYVLTTSKIVIWEPYVQNAWRYVNETDVWAIGLTIPYNVHCLLAAITSGLTIWELWGTGNNLTDERGAKAQKRGSITILIMNIGNFLVYCCTLLYMGIKIRMKDTDSSYFNFLKFFTFAFLPFVMSSINPLILLTRSTGVKKMITAHTMAADSAFETPGLKRRGVTPLEFIKNMSTVFSQ